EEALHLLARARAERRPRAEASERERDQPGVDEEHDDAGEARGGANACGDADGEVEARLGERERDHAAEVPREQRRAAQRREREPVEKPGLDVARELRAR